MNDLSPYDIYFNIIADNKTLEKYELIFATNLVVSYWYSRNTTHKRFKLGEKSIKNHQGYHFLYNKFNELNLFMFNKLLLEKPQYQTLLITLPKYPTFKISSMKLFVNKL